MIAILEAHKSGLFTKNHLANNMFAGLIVGIVALPLAMAFAIASGAKPEQGIYTAIIAGFLTSAFGGSRLQIAGPTGAFIVILSGITAKYGIGGLQMATLMAGCILVLMGLTKLGAVIKFIPSPVIVGFTTGIAVIIWVGQWHDFLGLPHEITEQHFHQKIIALLKEIVDLDKKTTLLGFFTLGVLLIAPKVMKKIPAPLIAMVFATLIQYFFQFDSIATIGTKFGGIPQDLPAFSLSSFNLEDLPVLIGPAFTITLLGAIESLLSAVVADSMTGNKHESNQELIGQGLSNIVAPMFGGFASTGAIARTATNIKNGGTSPLAGIVHAATLLLVILFLAPCAKHIPLSALSAILFVVAWNMSEIHKFIHIVTRAPKPDVFILLITFLLTVFSDIVIAVNIGVILASLLFMKRMSEAVKFNVDKIDELSEFSHTNNIVTISVDGPFFFGSVQNLESTLQNINKKAEILILRLKQVPFIDASGLEAISGLVNNCHRHNTRLIICEANKVVLTKIQFSGVIDEIGYDNYFEKYETAISKIKATN